jgi:phosphoesterase RecJ-like protein
MSEYKKLTLDECCEGLIGADKVKVLMHVRPDGDTVGSCAALCHILMQMGKDVTYDCGEPIPKRLEFLLSDIEKKPTEDRVSIAVDIPSPGQLGEVDIGRGVLLTIDHHEVNSPFSEHFTLGGRSSAGEVVYLVAKELCRRGHLTMTPVIAERLYAAISSDTGGFMFSNADADTYRAASELIALGIDHAEINRRLFYSKSLLAIKAEGFVADRLRVALDGRISYAAISREEREAEGIPFAELDTAIDVVRALAGSLISFVVKETDRGEYKASLRSVGADVASVAKRHSGGGHIRAAGCTVTADSVERAAEILIEDLKKIL